jgi:hypothetical protein
VTVSPPDLHAVTTRIPQAGVIVALPGIRRAYQSGDRAVGTDQCGATSRPQQAVIALVCTSTPPP